MTRIDRRASPAGGGSKVPPTGVRPTGDRAREGLFNSLGTLLDLEGAAVLDLYAGSGALGLEALSRGADAVVFVESVAEGAARAARQPRRGRAARRAGRRAARCPPSSAGAARETFDLVLADPPYATPVAEVLDVLAALHRGGWLAPGAVLVVERSSREEPLEWPTPLDGTARPPLRGGRAPVRSLPVRRAVCPGSFDPVTNGHVDVINRAAGLYDELVVAVLVNPGKAGLFSVEERMELLRDAVAELPNVRVDSFQGLLVDYCSAHDIPVIVKGLRAVSDFEYELQMAQMNRELAGIETLFVPTAPQVGHLSSSLVKQIATFGGDVSRLVPKAVHDRLLQLRSQGGPS